jgi:hypothetical protein
VGTRYLAAAGLTTAQQEALEEARTLRRQGETEKARDVLLDAGLDEDTMESLREAAKAAHEAMHNAIDDEDYEAFKEAIEGTPLADIITTEADFKMFVKAHELRKSGSNDEAKEILDELGMPEPQGHDGKGRFGDKGPLADLSEEQREALRVARQANDEETVKAILKEAGIDETELKTRHDEKHNKMGR